MNRVKMCLFVFIIFLILVTEKTFGMGIKMNGHYYPLPEDLIKRKVNEMWHEI